MKTLVGRCLLGLQTNCKNMSVSCFLAGFVGRMINKCDRMVNGPQCQPPSAAVGIYLLVQERDVLSGMFSCMWSANPVLTTLMDCDSLGLCTPDSTLLCM